jgi:hypothetical protein
MDRMLAGISRRMERLCIRIGKQLWRSHNVGPRRSAYKRRLELALYEFNIFRITDCIDSRSFCIGKEFHYNDRFVSASQLKRTNHDPSFFKSRSHLYHKTLEFINENGLIDEYHLDITTIIKYVMEAPLSKDKHSVAITQF